MSEINQELVDKITNLISSGHSQRASCKAVGIPESTWRSWKSRGKLEEFSKPLLSGTTKKSYKKRLKLKEKGIVATCVQNNTYVHEGFLSNLVQYCEDMDYRLIISKFSYNKNGFQNGPNESVWYDPKVLPYIVDESAEIFDGLIWCGELNILPTAADPLSGLMTYTKKCSGIIPHVKVRLQSAPTEKHKDCRLMYTTGSLTYPNYIQQKSGQKAEFHHTIGAVVAEVSNKGNWFVRQLLAESDTGNFQDLDVYYRDGVREEGVTVEAINYGDLHSEKPDVELDKATFGGGGLLDTLKPKYQLCHDTLDFTKRNHHNIKDHLFRYKMQVAADGQDKVEDDIRTCVDKFKLMSRDWCETVVVESNHDLALLKWLKESDPKLDNVWNSLFYHECNVAILNSILGKDLDFSIFKWCCDRIDDTLGIRFLKQDESFVLCPHKKGSIAGDYHGHIGANGSRGSPKGFTALGSHVNTGHTHSAGIIDNVYTSGIKGSLEQGYNAGPSSWSQSDIITYSNGKRAIVTFKQGEYRA